MVLNISERKVDNAALIVFHQFVESLDQVFSGNLFFELNVSVLHIRLSGEPTGPGPLLNLGLMPAISEYRVEQSYAN